MVHVRLAKRAATEAELAQLVFDREARRTMLWGSPDPGPAYEQRARLNRAGAKLNGWSWLRGFRARRLLDAAAPTRAEVRAKDVAAWLERRARQDQTLRGASRLSALTSPRLKPGDSRALSDDPRFRRLTSESPEYESQGFLRCGPNDSR